MSLASDIMTRSVARMARRTDGRPPELFGGVFASELYREVNPEKLPVGTLDTSQIGDTQVQYFQWGYSPMDGTHKFK